MLRNIQGWQWVIIILAIVILVGWKRLPDAARSLGRSMRIFKSEVEQMSSDSKSAASSDTVDGEAKPESGSTASGAPARDTESAPPRDQHSHDNASDANHDEHQHSDINHGVDQDRDSNHSDDQHRDNHRSDEHRS